MVIPSKSLLLPGYLSTAFAVAMIIIPFAVIASVDGISTLAFVLVCILFIAMIVPDRWPILALACLPVLDVSTITGWQILEAYDLLLLLLTGVLMLNNRSGNLRNPGWTAIFIGLLYLCGFINALNYIATPPSSNLIPHLTPSNAIKLSKPVIWALLFIPFIDYQIKRRPVEFARDWIIGLMLGIVALAVLIFFEHASVAAYYDISTTFRAVGGFKTMRLGGQEIDGYLLFALPACLYALTTKANYKTKFFTACAAIFGVYAVFLTNTRWTYLASVFVLVAGAYSLLRSQNHAARSRNFRLLTACFLITALGFYSILSSDKAFIAERFERLQEDMTLRTAHWEKNFGDACAKLFRCVLGHGTGSYPTFNIASERPPRKPAIARIENIQDNARLYLAPGNRIYVSQQLMDFTESALAYSLDLHVLSAGGSAPTEISISICRHNMVNSYQCVKRDLFVAANSPKRFHGKFLTEEVTRVVRRPRHGSDISRTIVFAIHSSDAVFVADNISLKPIGARSISSENLIRNGNFEQGTKHWFALSDFHLLWHAKNLFLHLLVEYGLVGVILHLALLWILWRSESHADRALMEEKRIIAMTVFGFVLAGFTGSLLDNAKLKFIFLLTALILLAMKKLPGQLGDATTKYQNR